MSEKDRLKEIVASLPRPGSKHTLDDCARELLDWMASIEPTWGERIAILREERHFAPREIAASLMAYPLDHSLHMEITTNPILEQAGIKTDPKVLSCLMCGKEFERRYAGERALCSNRCADGYDAKQKALASEPQPQVS
jgi:hypothetical protein